MSSEKQKELWLIFVDFTKANKTVVRGRLWKVLQEMGRLGDLLTGSQLSIEIHTYIHTYIHHLSDLRSVLNMSTTMTLLMSTRACGLNSVMFARECRR